MLHIPVISVFLLLLHFPDLSKQQDPVQCKPVDTEPTCVCQLDDGQYISLLGIANENRKPSLIGVDSQEFIYSLNPCYGVSMNVPTGSCKSNDSMAGCQQSSDKKSAWGLGKLNTETIFINPDKSMYITYTGGQDTRNIHIDLVCSKSSKVRLEAEGDGTTPLEYIFTLTTEQVCPSAKIRRKKSGNLAGAIGLSLIFVAIGGLAVYFIVGILINTFALKKTGSDVIPQKGLWLTLPVLIKDGVLFTFKPLIRLVKKSDYEPLA